MARLVPFVSAARVWRFSLNTLGLGVVAITVLAAQLFAESAEQANDASGGVALMANDVSDPAAPMPGRTPAPQIEGAPATCSFTGSITATDRTLTGRLFRDGTPDTCSAPGSCSVFTTTGTRHYDSYTFSNTTGAPQCATVTVSTACAGTNFIYAAAYLGGFNPANLCQNWLADSADSPNPSATFSFNVPAGATVVIVLYEIDPDAGCLSYTLDVSNLCPPPPVPASCRYTGSIAAGDPTQTGRLFRDGVPDTCSATGGCAVHSTTGARRYDTYTFSNTTGAPQCLTATLNTPCNGTQFIYGAAYLESFNPNNLCQNWLADSADSPNPTSSFAFSVPPGATAVIVVHEIEPNGGCPMYTLDVAGCSTINVQSAASRKTHGAAGNFNVSLPVSGPPGIESRSGGATRDYTMVLNLAAAGSISVTGSPQAQVTSGSATVGSNGASNGGAVAVSGSTITIPLTNVANAQRLAVTLNGVNDGTTTRSITVPMSVLVGDTNSSGGVSATDIGQVKASSGQVLSISNFRLDVNASGGINATDISLVKAASGTALPPAANDALLPLAFD